MKSIRKWTRVAGAIYLLTILAAILNMIFIESKLGYTTGDDLFKTLLINQQSLRYSIAFEMVMFSSVIVLSVALYKLLAPVNKTLSLLAMSFRVGEAIIGGVAVLLGFGILNLLNGEYATLFGIKEYQGIILFLYELRATSYLVLYGFMSIGSLIVFYLMLKHNNIPKLLAYYGLLTYTLMLSWTFTNILVTDIPDIIEWICIGPGALFEMAIGVWFILKGIHYDSLITEKLDVNK